MDLLISLMLLMYARVLKNQVFSHLISLGSAELVSMLLAVKPPDFLLEVQFFCVRGGVRCVVGREEKKKVILLSLLFLLFSLPSLYPDETTIPNSI